MKLNREKTEAAMARACMKTGQIAKVANMPTSTLSRAREGYNIRPETLGKIAKALGVDPTEIMETEGVE